MLLPIVFNFREKIPDFYNKKCNYNARLSINLNTTSGTHLIYIRVHVADITLQLTFYVITT